MLIRSRPFRIPQFRCRPRAELQPVWRAGLLCCALLVPGTGKLEAVEADDAGWGSLQGRYVLTEAPPPGLIDAPEQIAGCGEIPDESLVVDPRSRGIAHIFVYLPRAPERIHPELRAPDTVPVVVDQQDCRFVPHVAVIHQQRTLVVRSSDPTTHNVHTFPHRNGANNFILQANDQEGQSIRFVTREPQPFAVKCDIHPWMRAWWLVLDHPYATSTSTDGRFTIDRLPAGPHRFRVWHERAGYLDKSLLVQIEAGRTTDPGTVKLPPAAFRD